MQEKKCFHAGFDLAIGADEAGRGSLAGPVYAAAAGVRLPICRRDFLPLLEIVRDSKKMSGAARKTAYRRIVNHSQIFWATAMVGPKIIDKINILRATKLAMRKAVQKISKMTGKLILSEKVICLVDGNFPIKISCFQKSIIGGDDKIFLIAAASIVAKVSRDRLMMKMDKLYPNYGFAQHKGYGTKQHLKALKEYGPCPIHRRTFAPIADCQ